MAAFWHPDAEQVELPSLVRPLGHRRPWSEMLEAYAAGFLARQAYEVTDVLADGDRLAVRLRWTATAATAAGPIPAGAELVAHVAVSYELRDGLILRQSSYDCYEPLPTAC
ncbi:nuclear transport factor 2 family protein [Nocardioides anomalus]|uniref:nuclear transport factor 2 family protein n=1 Tax=Nocardioides anomalus TaxID=2712223 RepID=UPI001E306534|nr:nuclear transport factor 2 family protein [Nocardioides anomalus]